MRFEIIPLDKSWFEEFEYFTKQFTETKFHILFSLLCIVLYVYKILKKSKFSNFRVFHIFMYTPIVLSTISLMIGSKDSKSSSFAQIILLLPGCAFLLFNSFFVLSILFLQLLIASINSKVLRILLFDTEINTNHLAVIVFIIMAICRFILSHFTLRLTMLDVTISFRLMDVLFLFVNIVMLGAFVIVTGLQTEDFCLIVNCSVYLTYFLLSHIATIILTVCKSQLFVRLGEFASNVYILPFLWILSLYIVESTAVRKWIQRKSEVETNDFQLAYITIG